MDCVTAKCGSQVQPTKMTLTRQQVLSSSGVRAYGSRTRRVVGSNPIWGSDFFCVLFMVDSLDLPLFPLLISHFPCPLRHPGAFNY